MKRISILFAALISGAVAFPAAAASDPSPARGAVLFWLIDRNGDQTIDAREIEALRGAIFEAIDLNHDGRLTKDEAKAVGEAARARAAGHLAAVIKQGPAKLVERRATIGTALGLDRPDGITKAEFVKLPTPLLKNADQDNSGGVSRQELEAVSGDLRQLLMPE